MIQLNEHELLQQALQDKPQWHQSTRRSSNAMLCAQLLTCWWCSSVAISVCDLLLACFLKKVFSNQLFVQKVIHVWHVQCLYLYFQCPSTGQRYCIDPRHYERSSWGDHRRCGVHRCKGFDWQWLPVSMPVEITSRVCQDPIDCRVTGGAKFVWFLAFLNWHKHSPKTNLVFSKSLIHYTQLFDFLNSYSRTGVDSMLLFMYHAGKTSPAMSDLHNVLPRMKCIFVSAKTRIWVFWKNGANPSTQNMHQALWFRHWANLWKKSAPNFTSPSELQNRYANVRFCEHWNCHGISLKKSPQLGVS